MSLFYIYIYIKRYISLQKIVPILAFSTDVRTWQLPCNDWESDWFQLIWILTKCFQRQLQSGARSGNTHPLMKTWRLTHWPPPEQLTSGKAFKEATSLQVVKLFSHNVSTDSNDKRPLKFKKEWSTVTNHRSEKSSTFRAI